jgi:hypothetical protein
MTNMAGSHMGAHAGASITHDWMERVDAALSTLPSAVCGALTADLCDPELEAALGAELAHLAAHKPRRAHVLASDPNALAAFVVTWSTNSVARHSGGAARAWQETSSATSSPRKSAAPSPELAALTPPVLMAAPSSTPFSCEPLQIACTYSAL